jgi:hypothetical protein
MFSSLNAELFNREVGAYVIDKAIFPTVESIKTAPNIVPDRPESVTFKQGDQIIELRTVFLLIRG